jgi:uncharacterized small protein (DUF1192 family)
MRKMMLIMSCGLGICATANAALPSLSDLAANLTSMTERLNGLTERYAQTTNALAEANARMAETTNSIHRMIAALNATAEMRRAYHGAFTSRFETNIVERTIRRVDVYADGYEHVEPGHVRHYYTTEEEAARLARRKPKATLEDRIAALQSQIERLEEKRDNGTNEVEAAYAVIEIAAKRKMLARLEASQTNVVDVVVTPGR